MLWAASPALAQSRWDVDFNNDGARTNQDIIDRDLVAAGAEIPGVDSLDFNGDGVTPDDRDTLQFYQVYAGGPGPDGWTPVFTDVDPVIPVGPTREHRTIRSAIMALPAVFVDGVRYTPGTIVVDTDVEPQEVRGEYDSISVGGLPGRPLVIVGAPGDRPKLTWARVMNADHVRLIGLDFNSYVSVLGSSSNVLIEDVRVVGTSSLGFRFDGLSSGVGLVTLRRSIAADSRNPEGHVQGAYITNVSDLVIDGCVFYNTGNRDTFCQGLYRVWGGRTILTGNFFINAGFAGAQLRGGYVFVEGNVSARNGNGFGFSHPMAVPHGVPVWGIVSHNWVDQCKYPEWGIALMSGAGLVIEYNTISGCDVPFITAREQGLNIDTGDVTLTNNQVTQGSSLDWERIGTALRDRPRGVWGDRYDAVNYIP